ncbi:MAG: signal recognition particle protein [Stomatobaculum sp.]|jgi:signal recognition particle subunit SRP54|nr:signal recognition particle protein [Stomatobaculum sp.]
MAFESLTEKLQKVFRDLRGKGKLSEADVKAALKEVRMALLEADVGYKVVKQFIAGIQERAVGAEVLESLTPGQQVVKIVNEELIRLMGSETTAITPDPENGVTVIMMAGLQGAGKTTTAAKLAGKFRQKGNRPLLAACDVYRPAAVEQLKVNGEKVGVPVFSMGTSQNPVNIAKAALASAKENRNDILILDTAGRLQIDESMMQELVSIKEALTVHWTILVVDAMTGQEAVNVSKTFNDKVGIDGVIVTKLDGDTRGGAALSIRAVTGKPILYAGMGEKLSDLEQFYPDRMASRILGMGDILSLIEKAQTEVDEEKAKAMTEKLRKAEFDFNDFLDQMDQMKKLGGLSGIMSMLPTMGTPKGGMPEIDESQMDRVRAIILSMTKEERQNPSILNPSRKNRIAKGSGVDISEVNRLVKQFEQMRKMMKQLPGMMKGRRGGFGGMGMGGGLGGLFGKMKF